MSKNKNSYLDNETTFFKGVPLSKVERMVQFLKEQYKDKDVDLTFEFMLASLFPKALDNYLSHMKDIKMQGFAEGYAAGCATAQKDTKLQLKEEFTAKYLKDDAEVSPSVEATSCS